MSRPVIAPELEAVGWLRRDPPERRALVRGARSMRELAAYLPENYAVTDARLVGGELRFTIAGHDDAGWTLDGYVIPRLASGLIFAEEIGA